jgi:insertion element IS1 protein InsB
VSPGAWADVSPGVYLRRSITGGEATDRRYGHERQWHSRYCARVARQPYNSSERIKKKEPELAQVNQAVLKHLPSEHVEVEIWRADELEVRRGLSSELDEMWSYVRSKANPRWLWHAIDHHSGTVLAYVFGRRKDTVFLQLKGLLEPFGIRRFYTDGWGAYERHIDPEQHEVGKQYTQKIESKHINLRTRIKRLVRRTICFSKTTTMHDLVIGLFINRYEFGVAI